MKRIQLSLVTLRAVDELYASLPKLRCQQKCQGCCGPIPMTSFERQRILNRLGHDYKAYDSELTCGLLTGKGQCRVYDIRPIICRLWGMIDNPMMKCPFGCVPDRWLTDAEAYEIMAKIGQLNMEHK